MKNTHSDSEEICFNKQDEAALIDVQRRIVDDLQIFSENGKHECAIERTMKNTHSDSGAFKMFKSVYDFCDVVSGLVYCADDNSSLLIPVEDGTNDLILPCAKPKADGWVLALRRMMKEYFNLDVNMTESTLKVYRIWNPTTNTYINHVVFKVPVTLDKKKNLKSTPKVKGKIRWVQDAEMVKLSDQGSLKSPEIVDFAASVKKSMLNNPIKTEQSWPVIINYRPLETLVEVLDSHIIVQTEPKGNAALTPHEQLVKAAGFERHEQCILYQHFMLLCYPYMYMSKQVFINLALKIGWPKDQVADLFRAADIFGQNALSFRDYILMMAAVEPSTLHGGPPAEVRCHYIFRFSDKNNDGKMEYADFKTIIMVTRKSRNQPVDAASITRETDVCAKNMGLEPGETITLDNFVRAVGDLKLRGTSVLLRAPTSILVHIREMREAFQPKKAPQEIKRKSITSMTSTRASITKGGAQQDGSDYELAIHSVKLKKTGGLLGVDPLWQMDIGEPGAKVVVNTAKESSVVTEKQQFGRLMSVDSFNQKSLPNELLTGLHYFCTPISPVEAAKKGGKSKDAFAWGQIDPIGFGKVLLQICAKANEVCRKEPRYMELQSPVYVFGDLHGNFPDLMYFEKVLWGLGPSLIPSTLLFLGDYVDRGPHGVEVVAYLFAYKVQNPLKLKLIRGNHEIRDIQKMFTFLSECTCKFGETLGREVWNKVNDVFDSLPLAASIDGKIFCCHGGIPPPWLCPVVSAINNIPCPLSQPDQQSALAWDLMWNDPVMTQKLPESTAMELLANEGFAANTRRGTAHVFSVEALERFLTVNGFSHVVRAHEVQQAGFLVQQKGKLVTVFSSSKYCGGTNEAACILAYLSKLRVFRINTST